MVAHQAFLAPMQGEERTHFFITIKTPLDNSSGVFFYTRILVHVHKNDDAVVKEKSCTRTRVGIRVQREKIRKVFSFPRVRLW